MWALQMANALERVKQQQKRRDQSFRMLKTATEKITSLFEVILQKVKRLHFKLQTARYSRTALKNKLLIMMTIHTSIHGIR